MKNKEVFEVENLAGVQEFIYLEIGNDWQTMLKSEYDEQQAQQVEHLTEIPTK